MVIVNDGSTKKEDVELLESLAAQDPRIKVVHKENGGPSVARNYGAKLAKTNYLVPLDCDDLLEPTYLEYCWWMLEKNPKAAWAYTDSVGFGEEEYLWEVPFDPVVLKTANHLTATAMIRKKWFEKVGGYAEVTKRYDEDWYFWLKVVANGGYPVQAKGGEYLFWYRRSKTGGFSLVRKDNELLKRNKELIKEAAEDVNRSPQAVIYLSLI